MIYQNISWHDKNCRHSQNMQSSLNINVLVNFLATCNCNISKSKFVFPLSNEVTMAIISFVRLEVMINRTEVLFFRIPSEL